ncbi:MAG: NYN domain-containing protein [Chloroflexus sp.]|uniref:NYN domain-containing protein n=1 Tax=Chloroflexus sp. TaxID=1904827 RepID=UPI0021DBB29A|nr:NYN domain-containing protein [Chloroflexus sp.]GIV90495.1 MAG: NYN domain-containing protein [Chloroflexus sp.]
MNNFCRIGVFYDGSYFSYAQTYFYAEKKVGWLSFTPFHRLIEQFISSKEQRYAMHRIVYASWHQGLFPASQTNEKQFFVERNRHLDLMHAGIEPKYVPMAPSGHEKGVDVSLAVDVMERVMEGKIDVAVLVTGDGDLTPLARTVMKHGVRVGVFYFEYDSPQRNSRVNGRLITACNYAFNVNDLERDPRYATVFKTLFRVPQVTAAKE